MVVCSRIVNLVVAVLMVLGGVSQFFPIRLYVFPPPSLRGLLRVKLVLIVGVGAV